MSGPSQPFGDPTRWTRQQIDDRIATWNRDLQLASQNILELMDDISYKSLAGDGGLGSIELTGVTKQQVTPVLSALDEMWQALPMLTKVIDEANERYKKLPWFKDTEPLWQIQQLLDGDSVKIITKTTYSQRGLLTPDEVTRTLRPERVLEAMVEGYARAKEIIVRVGDAIKRLGPQIEEAEHTLTELVAAMPASSEVARLTRQLEVIRKQLVSDPLGLADTFDRDIAPAIEKMRRGIEGARQERKRIESDIANADGRIAALRTALAEASTAYQERRDKIQLDREPPAPFAGTVIDELVGWLTRLRGTVDAGKWQPAKIGLQNWNAQVDARVAECRAVAAENQRAIDRRNELRGLLDGLKAKAVDIGRGEDPVATELYSKAHKLLYARPTPLAAAEKLVNEYLRAVR
jgi:hypothetical protein